MGDSLTVHLPYYYFILSARQSMELMVQRLHQQRTNWYFRLQGTAQSNHPQQSRRSKTRYHRRPLLHCFSWATMRLTISPRCLWCCYSHPCCLNSVCHCHCRFLWWLPAHRQGHRSPICRVSSSSSSTCCCWCKKQSSLPWWIWWQHGSLTSPCREAGGGGGAPTRFDDLRHLDRKRAAFDLWGS